MMISGTTARGSSTVADLGCARVERIKPMQAPAMSVKFRKRVAGFRNIRQRHCLLFIRGGEPKTDRRLACSPGSAAFSSWCEKRAGRPELRHNRAAIELNRWRVGGLVFVKYQRAV